MFLLVFLYSCLKLERYAKIACFDDEYEDQQSTPPDMIAARETVTAMWLSIKRGYSFFIIKVGVK